MIHYEKAGSGPGVLLIQGVGLAGNAWAPQIAALAPHFTTLAVDNCGIGRSPPPSGRVSIEQMARDALAVADAEGIDRFHVVGHSMGGLIAQELALVAPGRVISLALLCTFVRGRDAMQLDWTTIWTGIRSRVGTRRARRTAFLAMIAPTDGLPPAEIAALEARLAAVFERDLADQPPIAMQQLRAAARYDAGERLGTLGGIPTLVMSAAQDTIARPESGRALAAAIPGARYLELPGAGHAVPAYRPDEVNVPLLEHLLSAKLPAAGRLP